MLSEVGIENFRCLQSVTVPLRPFTALIGPNDSGKTAFLLALEYLLRGPHEVGPADFWRRDQSHPIHIWGSDGQGGIDCWGRAAGTHTTHQPLRQRDPLTPLAPVQRYQLAASGVPMQCGGFTSDDERTLAMGGNGERTAALLDYFLRRDRTRFFRIVQVLQQHVPGLQDIVIGTPDAATRRVDIVIENGFQLAADEASAGVRLMLFFVALAHHPRPPRTILVEEPENGIHPKRLGDIVRLFHAITKGEFGDYPAQVILTTHSPYLLDYVDVNEDQVLVFRRNDDGSRTAEPVDADRLRTFLDEFMLGEIWFNQEEAGLVAKP